MKNGLLKLSIAGGLMTLAMSASAVTKEEARAMAPGSWPTKLQCEVADGKYTGYREEQIGTDGGVLTRKYLDPQCEKGKTASAGARSNH